MQEGPQYGKSEITKIYASVGWNPEKNEYFKDYAKMDKEELAAFYGNYLGDEKAAAAVEPFIQSNIEWVLIHKLPDHAYFNHAQHVKVGKVECTTCHGEVGEMEEVYQHSPLTMGWCINCHRKPRCSMPATATTSACTNITRSTKANTKCGKDKPLL